MFENDFYGDKVFVVIGRMGFCSVNFGERGWVFCRLLVCLFVWGGGGNWST